MPDCGLYKCAVFVKVNLDSWFRRNKPANIGIICKQWRFFSKNEVFQTICLLIRKQGKNAKAYLIQKAAYYLSENQITRRIIEKKWQKMLAGIRKKPTFAPQFNAEERWVSGWNQQFAKLSYPEMGTGGSNPPFSAKDGRRSMHRLFFRGMAQSG